MNEQRTLQKSHRSVETLRTKLIITKRSQKLADEYVGLLWNVQLAHVPEEDLNPLFPLCAPQLL